jgi:hypothetical protein
MGMAPLAEIRREEILSATFEVIKREGINRTTVARIANEVGVSKGIIHHYFKETVHARERSNPVHALKLLHHKPDVRSAALALKLQFEGIRHRAAFLKAKHSPLQERLYLLEYLKQNMPRIDITKIRRSELEQAAYEVAVEFGLRGSTIEGVAKHAGVSKGLIHRYFWDKDELLMGSVRYGNRDLSQRFVELVNQDT